MFLHQSVKLHDFQANYIHVDGWMESEIERKHERVLIKVNRKKDREREREAERGRDIDGEREKHIDNGKE